MQMELTASSELLFINTVELAVLANRAEAVPANQVARLRLGQPTLVTGRQPRKPQTPRPASGLVEYHEFSPLPGKAFIAPCNREQSHPVPDFLLPDSVSH